MTKAKDLASTRVKGTRTQGFKATVSGVLLNTSLPRRMLRSSTSYRLPGDWSRLTLGGSLSYQNGIYFDENYGLGRATQGSVTLIGLMARYEFSRQLSASLNIENLGGKRYYAGLGGYNGYTEGTPRNAWLKLQYKF